RSQAKYQFEKGGSFWNPTSNVYHCTVLSSKFEMDGDKEDDVLNDLRCLYDQQKQINIIIFINFKIIILIHINLIFIKVYNKHNQKNKIIKKKKKKKIINNKKK